MIIDFNFDRLSRDGFNSILTTIIEASEKHMRNLFLWDDDWYAFRELRDQAKKTLDLLNSHDIE